MLISILIAVGIASVLGIITAVIIWRVNFRINSVQRNLNRLENALSAADCRWLSDVLADFVVGDVSSLHHKLREFVESDDITEFFIDKIGMGVTEYTIRETAKYYPERFERIREAFEIASATESKSRSPRRSSNK